MEVSQYRDDSVSQDDDASDLKLLVAEMKNQNFDVIRFASYRTACKLRFVQKRVHLHLVDIWNMIEAFRENGLNVLEPRAEVSLARARGLVASVYYQLNKRLPHSQQVDVSQCISLLINWLLATYEPEDNSGFRVLSLKISLSIMCAGKLVDKLRYIFSLLADNNGQLIMQRFADFLREAQALPFSVFESPTFHYSDMLPGTIFDPHAKITVNDFLDVLAGNHGPDCLVWVPLLHRLANVENVLHPVQCDGCNRESFLGFRYKCQRCYNYQLCQDCFWRGRVSGSHTNQHEVKEYTAYKSPSKQLGHSLRKSFRCVPDKPAGHLPRFPDEPERTLDLSHIVPPSPMPSHNGFPDLSFGQPFDSSSVDGRSLRSPVRYTSSLESRHDEEHRLIARYAARLAHTHGLPVRQSTSELSLSADTSRQRELIAQLEAKNREIMRGIMRLRQNQEQEDAALRAAQNPALLSELRALRQRKQELEGHLSSLQDSRRDLMLQLEALMKMLKNHQASPRSTPTTSPHSVASKSPSTTHTSGGPTTRSAPATPGGTGAATGPSDSLTGVGDDVRLAFGRARGAKNLRDDLLVAADSVTNAMSSLVRELNSEDSEGDDAVGDSKALSGSRADCETEDGDSIGGGNTLWREDLRRETDFLAEIQARDMANRRKIGGLSTSKVDEASPPPPPPRTAENGDDAKAKREDDEDSELYDNDPQDLDASPTYQRHASLATDDESYVRTDDEEEGANTDWEDNLKRWVNR
ncbi:dystrobrevin beta-like isoform X2 [Ornithodoros turicata]|uniref:dystrobrevin beta-like isoform X2 n=1 Tax=Ornithodoros turicata TaxID=34597 RepID=UPI00313987F8